ncbi:hypothetical protein BH23ACT12_BH23ACT12_01920 [soil metagenome]
MLRKPSRLVPCLLAALLLAACSVLSSNSDPAPGASPTSGSTSGSSSSSSSSAGGSTDKVTGSGRVKTEPRSVAGFDRIRISGIGELVIDQTGEESLTIEAEDNLLPLLVSEVEGNRLTLGLRPNTSISTTRPIVYRLNVKSLREISGEGTVQIAASGLDTAEFALNTSGTVVSVLSGSAQNQNVLMSGAGSFDGRNLFGRTAEVEVSGTAQAVVNVTQSLSIRASGTAVVRYLGDPQVNLQTSGLGKAEKAQ